MANVPAYKFKHGTSWNMPDMFEHIPAESCRWNRLGSMASLQADCFRLAYITRAKAREYLSPGPVGSGSRAAKF